MRGKDIINGQEYAVKGRYHGMVYRVRVDHRERFASYHAVRSESVRYYFVGNWRPKPEETFFVGESLHRATADKDPNFGVPLAFRSRQVLMTWNAYLSVQARKAEEAEILQAERAAVVAERAVWINHCQNELIARGIDPERVRWPAGTWRGASDAHVPLKLLAEILNPALVAEPVDA